MKKAKIGILGTGNIGTDLLMKILNTESLECTVFAGHNPDSSNIKMVSDMGISTSIDGVKALVDNQNNLDIIIDATSAKAHMAHSNLLERLGKYVINLTPTETGKKCVPFINGEECVWCREVNMITCGGQATIPLAYAIVQAGCSVSYIETVSTISAKSAGKATRENIDEFIETTSGAMKLFTGVNHTKSIMIINPNEPPVNMRNTIYFQVEQGDLSRVCEVVERTELQVKRYVPGYKIIVAPSLIDNILAITVEVSGNGDFLPEYAGNLDIITCAAIEMAEKYYNNILIKER